MVTDTRELLSRFESMADFKKLIVWQKAHALALNTHRIAAQIRGAQNASLRNQMTRAAQSIAANIVEGRGQKSEKDFARFLGYALNSASELEYHLMMARDIKAISMSAFEALAAQLAEVRKMLHGLIARLGCAPHIG
jgi:four helix bundle protein